MPEYDGFIASLEALGEPEVRSKLSQGVWASKRKQWADDWLSKSAGWVNIESARTALRVSKFAFVAAIAAAILGAAATLTAAFVSRSPTPMSPNTALQGTLRLSAARP